MRKRTALYFCFVILFGFLVSFVAADCDDNQTILRLYSADNSHGAFWNESITTYNVKVCYNEIFGYNYSGSNPHECKTGASLNKIIGLSGLTNAHAEKGSLSVYTNSVCFGNLVCSAKASCDSSEKVIVYLSSDTNAHISKTNTAYPVRICCKPNIVAYWADLAGNPINRTNLNNLVSLVVIKDGEFTGERFNFSIYKNVLGGSNFVGAGVSQDFASWEAKPIGEYYFIAESLDKSSAADSRNTNLYGTLRVIDTEENQAPIAVITHPLDREIYFLGQNISFNQSSYDADSFFNYTWNFDDGGILKGNSSTMENYNTAHIFNTTGQKNIVLTVKDLRSPYRENSTKVSLLLLNESESYNFTFADISKPEWGTAIDTTQNEIIFNAERSYIIRYDSVTKNVTCIGGFCPREHACPIIPLIPTDCKKSVIGAPANLGSSVYTNVKFIWAFSKGESSSSPFKTNIKTGSDGKSFTLPKNDFTSQSNNPFEVYWAKLRLEIA